MDRLFLDANVLFSAAYKVDSRIRGLWRLRDVALYSSRYAFEEAWFNLEEETQRARLSALSEKVKLLQECERRRPLGVDLPEKDAPILLAAIEARADYLLTGDFRHFGPFLGKKIEGVTIILPAEYFKRRG
jgi:uncharacterized protein